MGSIGGSSCKNTSRKIAITRVPVEAMCVLPKTKPGHSPIHLPHTSLWWCGSGYWHRSKLFHCSGYGQWLLTSSGRRGVTWKTGIINPVFKSMVESDSYGVPKCTSKIIVDDVLLYGLSAKQLLAYFGTVLDVLKYHRATLKLKRWKLFQYRCNFSGMDVAEGETQPA